MTTELLWPRHGTFVERSPEGEDDQERRYVGEGIHEVPDHMVDAYLDAGWERPDSEEAAPAAADQEPEESDETDEAEAEPDAVQFDAEGFVDDSWQSVTAAIEDGEADGHLDAVEAAEQDRDGDPRGSVQDAIEDRR